MAVDIRDQIAFGECCSLLELLLTRYEAAEKVGGAGS